MNLKFNLYYTNKRYIKQKFKQNLNKKITDFYFFKPIIKISNFYFKTRNVTLIKEIELIKLVKV